MGHFGLTISVVTVVLEDGDGLIRTANSVLCQSIKPEWVICDGGSGSVVTDILERLGNKARSISEADQGIYDAMNKGVRMCSGDFVVFLNAGDIFPHANVMRRVTERLVDLNADHIDVLFGGANIEFPNGRSVYRAPRSVERYVWHGLPANHQATYYRREILGSKTYDLEFRICGDYYLAARLYKEGASVGYLDEPLAIFQVGGASYRHLKHLFFEPYRIQRDVLGLPLQTRFLSLVKRFVSTAGMVALAQPRSIAVNVHSKI